MKSVISSSVKVYKGGLDGGIGLLCTGLYTGMNFSLVPLHNDLGLNFDGVCDSVTGNRVFLLNGNISVVRNPAITFVMFMLQVQAFPNNCEKLYHVTTFPGILAR